MKIDTQIVDLEEIGSGYGTFTIPSAKRIQGKLFAFDIEDTMIESLNLKILDPKIN